MNHAQANHMQLSAFDGWSSNHPAVDVYTTEEFWSDESIHLKFVGTKETSMKAINISAFHLTYVGPCCDISCKSHNMRASKS